LDALPSNIDSGCPDVGLTFLMRDVLDLDRYPLDRIGSSERGALVDGCRAQLDAAGMFNLDGLIVPTGIAAALAELAPLIETEAFTHKRRHNIYFLPRVAGLADDHPALATFETVNHTICADRMPDSVVCRIYEWPPLAQFLAEVMGKPALFTMADPLARANVMAYRAGDALNWHFDRSEFTTTLLLQAPQAGGAFQYRRDLRTDADPNYDGVAALVSGQDYDVATVPLAAGTLNVFKGKNTAHRVTPVEGPRERVIAVLSYYERPGVMFSDDERVGFYGRAN
jgi:hypothetical protein